jgi:hypothetical protein
VRFDIPEAKGEASGAVRVPLPDGLPRGHYQLGAVAELGSGIYIRSSYPLVDHPHVRATPVPRPATFEIAAADIRLPELGAIGFVTGASDREPEALAAIGLPVVTTRPTSGAGAGSTRESSGGGCPFRRPPRW